MSSIESLYETAQSHHRAGRLEAAKSLYREILQRDSLFARAWHLLGVVLHQQGDTQAAIEHIQRALERTGGNKKAAAQMLGLSRRALYRRLEKHGIKADESS